MDVCAMVSPIMNNLAEIFPTICKNLATEADEALTENLRFAYRRGCSRLLFMMPTFTRFQSPPLVLHRKRPDAERWPAPECLCHSDSDAVLCWHDAIRRFFARLTTPDHCHPRRCQERDRNVRTPVRFRPRRFRSRYPQPRKWRRTLRRCAP